MGHRVRKELKIRPGFTPQEDVSRFRGSRQKQLDAVALPKGHILGWVAPSSDTQKKAKTSANAPPPNKNAKRRANRRAKAAENPEAVVKDNWEDDDEGEGSGDAASGAHVGTKANKESQETLSTAAKDASHNKAEGGLDLVEELSKLNVK